MFSEIKYKTFAYLEKHETRLNVIFFVVGFIFDIFTISAIDSIFGLAQQALYLLIIAGLIHYEILFRMVKWRPGRYILRAWPYRTFLMHFLLGSLLNVYSLFYIKSSSLVGSIAFLILMVVLIVANEFKIIKEAKVSFKVGLYVICLFSFVSILVPLLLGFIGWLPFALAVVATLGVLWMQIRWLRKKIADEKVVFKALLMPATSVLVVFTLFYWAGWIPPVPLSTKYQGIYHLVEKKQGSYYLSTEKLWWQFWHSGDQNFRAEPGDTIYYYSEIYSPAAISGEVYILWFFKTLNGRWQQTDRIPLSITGGRESGYRGYAMKGNYKPGQWRVLVETSSGQEISRLNFEISEVQKSESRTFAIIQR